MKSKTIKDYIDVTLTSENCKERGYYWNGDIIINPDIKSGTYATYKSSFDEGYLLGKPKVLSDAPPSVLKELYGLYILIKTYEANETPDYNVDDTLTPQNAAQRGLVYLYDVYYSRGAPREINEKVIELVEKKGYLLGTNSDIDEPDSEWVGVYSHNKNNS